MNKWNVKNDDDKTHTNAQERMTGGNPDRIFFFYDEMIIVKENEGMMLQSRMRRIRTKPHKKDRMGVKKLKQN